MSSAIQTVNTGGMSIQFDAETQELIRDRYFIEGASDAEFQLFVAQAQHRGLDPTRKHIYAVERWDGKKKRNVIAYQVSIDGLRLIAQRTGRYEGQTAPLWCGTDGEWTDVWLQQEFPAAAKVGVYVRGHREPTWGVAKWDSYVQTTRDGNPTQFWKKMSDLMLAKCAEALALRKAFPEEMGGLYTSDEMGQARADAPVEPQDAPYEVEAHIGTPDTPNGTERLREPVIRELHAVAKSQLGWGHDMLKQYYQSQGFDSLKDMTVPEMQSLARSIRDDPDRLRKAMEIISDPPPLEDEWQSALIDLEASGSVDVKDWEQMTRKAGTEEGRWAQLWDLCPTSLIANMLRIRTKEEDMLTDKVRMAREEARRRLTEVATT